MAFCVWLLLLGTMFSRFTLVAAWIDLRELLELRMVVTVGVGVEPVNEVADLTLSLN